MTAKRANIYMNPPLERARQRAQGSNLGLGFSGMLGRICERYELICRRSLPSGLSQGDWDLLRDALNGIWLGDSLSVAPAALAAEVADGCSLDGLDGKWGVDGPALARAVAAWTPAEAIAAVESIERWWGRDDSTADDPPECEFGRAHG